MGDPDQQNDTHFLKPLTSLDVVDLRKPPSFRDRRGDDVYLDGVSTRLT